MAPIAPEICRRATIGGAALLLPQFARAAVPARTIQKLEQQSGARIGLAALDTGTGKSLFHRQTERFVMCSTFKLSLAAAILARADKGEEKLDRLVMYDKPVLGVSPATTRNWPHGMTVAALCEAAIIYSDNTAANVLLAALGGPGQVTAFWRSLGDATSRLDDIEPKLNIPDGARNTATPAAMLGNLNRMLLGDALSAGSRALLLHWMAENTTGGAMLRAGLPSDWTVGDKTGRWNGDDPKAFATNDLAIATPPTSNNKDRKPILVVCYTRGGPTDDNARAAVIASVGKILAETFA
jgi:beta-lactamase class A